MQLPFVLFARAIDSGTSLFVLANCQLGSLGSSFLQQVINPPKNNDTVNVHPMTFNPCSIFISPNTPNHPTPSPTNVCVCRGRETVRFLPLTLLLEQLATFIDGAVSRDEQLIVSNSQDVKYQHSGIHRQPNDRSMTREWDSRVSGLDYLPPESWGLRQPGLFSFLFDINIILMLPGFLCRHYCIFFQDVTEWTNRING